MFLTLFVRVIKEKIKKIFNSVGYDIVHLPSDPFIRQKIKILKKFKIDLIFDIGANTGQFATELRSLGYNGRIISFEPLPLAYQKLMVNASKDSNWDTIQIAIGNMDGEGFLHISENSYSSSFLDMLPRHIESAPDSVYTGIIKVPVCKLDTVFGQYYNEGRQLLVKVDTQGFERKVLEGCYQSIGSIKGFQMELSLVPMYDGETLMQEMNDLMRNNGFKLLALGPGHQDYFTGEILQVEAIFFR